MNYLKVIITIVLISVNTKAFCYEDIFKNIEAIESDDATDEERPKFINKKKAKIIILNKITAKSELVEFKLNEIKFFGNLSIEVSKCVKNTDPVKTSSLMFINVFDNNPDEDRVLVFSAWLDSANLAISTVEHPVYEVIPQDCID